MDKRGKLRPGSLYVDHLNEFAEHHWDSAVAREHSESLNRALIRLGELQC